MAQEIARRLSVHLGDLPESGQDMLNQRGESFEVALARQLVSPE
ncbi:hypothetical protein ACFQ3P_42965 [Paraburkholderia sabiae]|uniref:Uncharacterized protein n=1 Tax=Paraburkholderia sabiae TaxID=273251 RepID=A0ABU9QTS8_9BURK|nr:hypothetical protein [Paraburkholderia sabiae]